MTRRIPTLILAALVLGGTLAGCAPQPEVSETAAGELQSSVRLIADHAASNDLAAAVAELDALQARLDAAVEAGEVTAERADTIQVAIDLVRADLAEQIAAAEVAEAERVAAEKLAAEKLAEEQAAADEAAREQAEQDEEDLREAEKEAREAQKDAEEEARENAKPGRGNNQP